MHIGIITPAAVKSLSGNRATAQRWADFLIQLGHKVTISVTWDKTPFDILIALHAWRSADAVAQFKKNHPNNPIILALTGTDLYRFILTHPEPTLASIQTADRLVVLHDLAYKVVPQEYRKKIHVIYQSALPLTHDISRSKRYFDICVVGHLRDEKDSLRAAYAVRDLPNNSRIRIRHYGKAHNDEWVKMAEDEMKINDRYHWFGEVKQWQIREAYGKCHLMVLSSNMEGGANVISEATIAKLPVIASNIDGSIGLLGKTYPGYYPVQNTASLTEVLLKAETDAEFVQTLSQHMDSQLSRYHPDQEKQSWHELLSGL